LKNILCAFFWKYITTKGSMTVVAFLLIHETYLVVHLWRFWQHSFMIISSWLSLNMTKEKCSSTLIQILPLITCLLLWLCEFILLIKCILCVVSNWLVSRCLSQKYVLGKIYGLKLRILSKHSWYGLFNSFNRVIYELW
jgi:hypothetical protein